MGYSLTSVLIIPLLSHPPYLPPPGSDWPYHLAPCGSLPFSLTLLRAHFLSSPDSKMCHFTHSLARTFHVLSLPILLTFHPDNPKCISIQSLAVLTSGPNHPTVQVGATTMWCSLPLAGCVSAIPLCVMAEASCFPPEVTYTSSLCSVLFPSFFLTWNLFPILPSVFPVKHRSNPSIKFPSLLANALWKMKKGHRMKWID